ncbi:S-layer homology domain-containing protein [Paenibacillus sp. CGMCC 1.16610]|nr:MULTISPECIES: S-layer homology domain-containing protein [Paenibacillus]MBA2938927.1 S-layer homology domain-containing protein [Paenibacillus sp. CGMCC 1.16610]
MKKLVLSLFIVLFVFGTSFSQIRPVYAAESDFTFTVGSNGATVTDYKGTDLNVVIPAAYAGTMVTEIGRSAFDTYGTGKPQITSVVIPNSVKVIQTYGFRYTSLTSIDLPDSLLTIGSSAFENNPLTSVVFPDSVTMIGNYSFYMNNLTTIKLSENLKTINGGAFDTNHITKLVIPAGVTKVDSSSFYNNNLTSITVLGDATTFGTGVFASNPGNLKIFGIANSPVSAYASSNGHTFVDGTALFQAVAGAKSLLKSHLTGTGVGQVPANTYNNLSAAYDTAKLFIDGIGNATIASDLANAAIPLTSSIAAFNADIIQAGNPAALAAAITAAQQLMTNHPQGVNVGQTSAADRSALQNAITAAQQIFNQAAQYLQGELDVAVAHLEMAIDTFEDVIISAGNPTALGAAITAAQQALTDHPQGVNVGQASAGARTALQTASNVAQQILDNASNYTQDQLDTAVIQLNSAVQVFNAAVLQAGIPTALGAAITVAQQALTDHPQGVNVGQASAGARTALETAKNTAQQILDNAGNYTQDQLDAAVNQLNSAVQVFNAAVLQAGVPTALGAAITAAQQGLTDYPQGVNVGQASAGVRASLETAKATAQQILDNASNYTQDQLDTAVNQLNSAVQVFNAAVIQAGIPTALGAAITVAQQALTDHSQGVNVGQASAGVRASLETAKDTAQQVLDNASNYTQDQLDTAVNQLNSAVQVFNAAVIQAGIPTALGAAITAAQQALTDHPEGTDVGQTSAGYRATLQTAIDAAQQILDNASNYTQDQLDTAVNQLNSAVQVFNAAVIQAGIPTALSAAITAAQQALTDHPEGTDVGQTSAVTRTALQTASSAAQQILANASNYTQDQLDTAVNQLNSAVQVFNAAVIQAGIPTALGAAITAAQQALTDHPEGTDVGQTSAVTRAALQTASNAAQQILANAGNYTQDQLDTAVNQLNSAVQVFNAAVIQAGIPTALGAAITAAQQALTDHPEGTDVGQTSAKDRTALQIAIDAAQAIAGDAKNQSQTRLDEATVSLNEAMAVFGASWVGVVLTASANDLYGTNDTLRFTIFYGYEVTVSGTPAVPIIIGDDSVTQTVYQTVYATYTGERGIPLTKLTFEYEIPAGLADVDGIKVAAALDLLNGASIVRTSSGLAASLNYVAPDASGIRIVAIPPDVALTAESNGSASKAISVTASVYGVTAGNALTELRWLPGSLSEADFARGTKGSDILAASQFTITANGDYSVYALDRAGNETVKSITITEISIPSSSDNGDRPITLGTTATTETTVKINMTGGITALVDPSNFKKITRSDGTVVEQVILPERTREKILELLKDAKEPFVSIKIGNREQTVQTQFPADWIAHMAQAYPNAIIEVRLNDSSYQLRLSTIDLTGLAKRLNALVSDLTVNIIQVQVGENVRQEINRIGVSQGFTVFADVIDYQVTAEAKAQTLEVHDFGESYTIRTIKLDRENMNRNLVAVQYIPANGTVIFVPSQLETGPDGTTEAILNVPHNSMYTVLDVQARTFADLNGHWAKADVEYLASKLLANGVAADRFAPEGTITRAEFSALLVRGLGLSVKENGGGIHFADVPASAWYASTVDAAVASGLVSGVGAGLFAPNAPITREEMAVVIASALTLTSNGTSSKGQGQADSRLNVFTDQESISSWAQEAAIRASEVGIMNGMEDGRFAPTEYATRAQAAVILKRLLQYVHFIK